MNQGIYDPYTPARATNGLGVAGFVCSVIGLLTGGILSPVGLILSLIALGRSPRGFAVAGVVVGLLGTCGGVILVLAILAFGLAVVLAAVGIFAFTQSERIELSADMAKIAARAEDYKRENRGIAPAGLEVLGLETSTLTDPWGNRYRYVLVTGEPGYDILSDGKDAKTGTADDVSLSKLDRYWEGAMADFERQMQEMEARRRGWPDDSASTQPATTGPTTMPGGL